MQTHGTCVPLFKLSEVCLRRRLQKDIFHQRDVESLERQLRLNSLELFFAFHKGPHKFNSGVYPKPSNLLLNALLLRVIEALTDCGKIKKAIRLKELISKIDTDKNELRNTLIFLLIMSNIKTEVKSLGSVCIPDKSSSDISPTIVFRNPELGVQIDAFNTIRLSKEDLRVQKLLNSNSCEHRNKNIFRSALNLDHMGHGGASLFCGAFVNRSSSFACGRALACDSSVALRIPPLSPQVSDESIPFLDCARTVYPSGDREDEGYAGSCIEGHIALDEQNALQTVLILMRNATSGIADIVVGEMFPAALRQRVCANAASNVLSTINNQTTNRFSWTQRGKPQSTCELPMLSELGPISVPLCLDVYQSRFGFDLFRKNEPNGLTETETLPSAKQISMNRHGFFQDFLFMHLGIQSQRFSWCGLSDTELAHSDEQVTLSGRFIYTTNRQDSLALGCSESALTNLLGRHLQAGTYYRQLTWLSRQASDIRLGSPMDKGRLCSGQTWACLLDAVSTCLTAYEEGIQLLLEKEQITWSTEVHRTVDKRSGLLRFSRKLKIFTDRIEYLADICSLTSPNRVVLHRRGIDILVHLAWRSMQAIYTLDEALIRFIFKRTCQPFLVFLEHLLLDGSLTDSAEEFNFHVSNKSRLAKDFTFWTVTFHLVASDPDDPSTRGFMNLVPASFEQDLIRCAKCIQLLKLVQPKHFIFYHRSSFPKLEFPSNPQAARVRWRALSNYLENIEASAVKVRATRGLKIVTTSRTNGC